MSNCGLLTYGLVISPFLGGRSEIIGLLDADVKELCAGSHPEQLQAVINRLRAVKDTLAALRGRGSARVCAGVLPCLSLESRFWCERVSTKGSFQTAATWKQSLLALSWFSSLFYGF